MRSRPILTILGILAAILTLASVGFLDWVAMQPRLGRPTVALKLVGYTNDAAGNRLATFAVTNLSASPIYVYMLRASIPSPEGSTPVPDRIHVNQWHPMIESGASENFTVSPPTNHTPWKVAYYVYNDFGSVQVIKRFLAGGRNHPFFFDSDWFDSTK